MTGIPATGKTEIGEYLGECYGFAHCNFEAGVLNNNLAHINSLVAKDSTSIAISWGFVPDETSIVLIEWLQKKHGFKLFWFDGNRSASLREFIRRGTVPEIRFYGQMYEIERCEVVKRISPQKINPFDESGKFRQKDDIIKELGILDNTESVEED